MLAALGQGDAQQARGDLGVLEEQFVEVAHPEEDDGVRLLGLGRQILAHDGSHAFGGGGLRGMGEGSVHANAQGDGSRPPAQAVANRNRLWLLHNRGMT
jgi:hypothetical protein